MTRMLYMDGGLDACYERAFTARVVEAQADYVTLDQTLFYPLGGGQEWDTGVLRRGDGLAAAVREVTKRGPVKHVLGQGHGLAAGDAVAGEIDWERRYAHMRMHTAQHLVSGLAYEMFVDNGRHARTVGNQIHRSHSRIDFHPVNLTNGMLADLQAAANDAIRAGYPVESTTMTREDVLQAQPPERTNMDLLPRSVQELRVIRIGEDVDLCPCAGTHVLNTREIGELTITRRTSKGQGTQRVEYTLEGLGEPVPPQDGR